MRWCSLLFSVYLGLLSCLPPNTDVHELAESLALRDHHAQAHHDTSLLAFLLDHYAGQGHPHHGSDQEHRSLPFHHAHDCPFVLVAWATPLVMPVAPAALARAGGRTADYTAGAPISVTHTCWQPPRA
ncbi:MAG: hypothetical protein H7Z21_08860 [Hymenobacter sp.]|nr:hypothetical protein [Hymenobacter sp.]